MSQTTITVLWDDAERIPLPVARLDRLRWAPAQYALGAWVSVRSRRVVLAQGRKRPRTSTRIPYHTGWGDYTLEHHERIVAVERKWDIGELHKNLFTRDRHRFRRTLSRFAAHVKHPYLYLDMGWSQMFPGPAGTAHLSRAQIEDIWDTLLPICHGEGVGLIGPLASRSARDRLKAAEWVVRIMLSHVWHPPARRRFRRSK